MEGSLLKIHDGAILLKIAYVKPKLKYKIYINKILKYTVKNWDF